MKKTTLAVVITAALAGCKETSLETIHSVDWYRKHASERAEQLSRCRANPGELADTPNCMNAEQAESLIDAFKRGGLNVEPMTDIKMGRQNK